MSALRIEFTDKEVTPWAGMVLMRNMLEKMDFHDVLGRCGLPGQGSNRGYAPQQLMTNFLLSVWSGANCFEHLEVTRHDKAISDIFDWHRMPGHRAFKRYFQKFDQATNQRVFDKLYRWFFSNLQFDNCTLDFDSSVLTRYGAQQGAAKGYNRAKPGRMSHHPIMAFVHECRMVANCWLRAGNASATNNFLAFLEDTFQKLENKKVSLIRADSGFYSKEIFDYLENREQGPVNYVVACRFYTPIKRKMANQRRWLLVDDGIEIAETTYQAEDWEQPRRLVMVRQKISRRPKAAGKQLRLFEDEAVHRDYRYSCFITNMDLSPKMVYDLYRNRADAENRIKELKYDFGFGSFNTTDFWATEAILNMVMLAYNLMSLFRQAVMGSKVHHQMKTLRYRVFAIGGYLVKNGNSRILKLSLQMKRREWFTGLWGSTKLMGWPFVIE